MEHKLGLLFLVCGLASTLLAEKVHLIRSELVPAASGEIEVSRDKNKNTEIDINVEHLAKPSNLTPPKSTYVVWIRSSNSDLQNLGQLTVNSDLKGEFKTVTPLK